MKVIRNNANEQIYKLSNFTNFLLSNFMNLIWIN